MYLIFMLLPKNFINSKIFMFLRFRSLFFSSDILGFFILTKTEMSELVIIKQNLIKANLNFQFFNNNFVNNKLSNLNTYLNSFNGSFIVIYFKSFSDLFKLNLENSYLFSCLYMVILLIMLFFLSYIYIIFFIHPLFISYFFYDVFCKILFKFNFIY